MRAAVVRARIERTLAIASTGLRPPPTPTAAVAGVACGGAEERRSSVPVPILHKPNLSVYLSINPSSVNISEAAFIMEII
jgi:hypothetical protein